MRQGMSTRALRRGVTSTLPIAAERPQSFMYNGFAPGSTDIIGYQPPGG